jgi:hypothetical protein
MYIDSHTYDKMNWCFGSPWLTPGEKSALDPIDARTRLQRRDHVVVERIYRAVRDREAIVGRYNQPAESAARLE